MITEIVCDGSFHICMLKKKSTGQEKKQNKVKLLRGGEK